MYSILHGARSIPSIEPGVRDNVLCMCSVTSTVGIQKQKNNIVGPGRIGGGCSLQHWKEQRLEAAPVNAGEESTV